MFERWKGRPGWLSEKQVGHLFRGRRDLSEQAKAELANKPVVIRKALAVNRMLEIIVDPTVAALAGTSEIFADELIVGTLPPFAVGQGKEFVRYLTEEEELRGALSFLNELSPMGHIVPNHGLLLQYGLEGLANQARTAAAKTKADQKQREFYEAVALCLDGVIAYAQRHAALAREVANKLATDDPRRESLETVSQRLEHAPRHPARSFHEALQAIYIVHCALHWTVEIVPIGRLDQLLHPYYERDVAAGDLTQQQAQELIDCFWIKLDERVILDNRHAENRFTASDGVLTGFFGSSNYDQGCLLNQWMQQVTIGGVLANDEPDPSDACNPVTELCLEAARRLPLNSPTLDLRVFSGTPRKILDLAAEALMSGGAHPVLLNDDVIVPALAYNSGPPIPLAAARNYACDGCYETMVAGESEFSFGFVSALDLIEKTLNRGAGLADSGPVLLRGTKDSWRSKPAAEIADMDEFRTILRQHMQLGCHRYLNSLATFYGNKVDYAPSPLLSALISGCLDKGRDLSDGGARYHIFSPLLVGVSNAADSLQVIEQLVFIERRFTLEELTTCLASDWGHRLIEQGGRTVPAFGPSLEKTRIDQIRAICVEQPKFGSGAEGVDRQAWWLMETFVECVREAQIDRDRRQQLDRLAEYGSEDYPFVLNIAPGVGTFEQYVFSGSFNGASADGRRSRAPIASDLSPAPIPNDMNVLNDKCEHARQFSLTDSLRSYRHKVMTQYGDGAPVDYNLPENYPPQRLADTLAAFAAGEGGSICTFTVADPGTFAEAQKNPERYNLVRVRMGGWTEFFVTLFPDHQEQHKRRPLYG
ncbi:pyruvate formate lyase family protein [Ensifer sp. IC4062]|nr:pyruvate formate lyase family protein [Ensifer sp. IC4062]MCA1441979.1 pyruvate formate lyase family protein [Ensifer sp. IC4062]